MPHFCTVSLSVVTINMPYVFNTVNWLTLLFGKSDANFPSTRYQVWLLQRCFSQVRKLRMEGFARRYPSVFYQNGNVMTTVLQCILTQQIGKIQRGYHERKGSNQKREMGRKSIQFKVCFWTNVYFTEKEDTQLNPPSLMQK